MDLKPKGHVFVFHIRLVRNLKFLVIFNVLFMMPYVQSSLEIVVHETVIRVRKEHSLHWS